MGSNKDEVAGLEHSPAVLASLAPRAGPQHNEEAAVAGGSLMAPAIATHLVAGREANDCAVCALAMYLGVSYEDVLREVAVRDRPHQGRQGLRLHEIERIARALGTPLRRVRKYDLSTAYGILSLPDHVVLVRNGVIIDPEPNGATMWEVEDYLHTYGMRPGLLLVARDEL